MSLAASCTFPITVVGLRKFAKISALFFALGSAMTASASTIYNTTGGIGNGGDPVAGAGPILADRFISPSNLNLDSITLNLALNGAPIGTFFVDIFSSTASGPGVLLAQIASVSDSTLNSYFALYTFSAQQKLSLLSGTAYYAGIVSTNSNAILGNTVDPNVLGRPDVAAGGVYFNNGGVQDNSGGPYEIAINTSPVPEPSSWALLLTGVGALGFLYRRSGKPIALAGA